MKQVRFYAVDDDLSSVLTEVERGANLQYVPAGVFPESSTESYSTGMQLPQIGLATADSAVNSDSFLVAEKSVLIRSRPIALQNGKTTFCIDQLDNPDTAVLTPAGRWEDVAVLYGTIGTASDSEASIRLVKAFERAMKKDFQKVKAFWVGPKAMMWLKEGKRLTIAIQSPKDFDLTFS
jgi:hypothetical protein